MKILMVTMAMHIGGAETHILELCRTGATGLERGKVSYSIS